MSEFGRDDNIICILAPLDSMTEEAAIFKALGGVQLPSPPWFRGKYWGDAAHTHLILVLCKTEHIKDDVKVVTDIPSNDLKVLINQAVQHNQNHFEVFVNGLFTMVYY